jgi:hypothetical protein
VAELIIHYLKKGRDMTMQNSTPEYVTREILNEEISASEKRLDAKIDTTAQSLKEYTDSRFTRLDTKTDSIERTVIEQGKKMDVYLQGIVKMVEGVT